MSRKPPGQWAMQYHECLQCHTTARKHVGKGLCAACYNNTYFKAHPEKWPKKPYTEADAVYNKAYRKRHHDRIKKRENDYARTHAQQKRANARQWRINNPEKAKALAQRLAKKNSAHKVEATRQWRKAHPELYRLHMVAAQARRRSRKLKAPRNDFTLAQWREMKEHYHHRCIYCGKRSSRLTQDHITPLSKGGSHTKANIVPACKSCNSRKGAGQVLVPIQPMLL